MSIKSWSAAAALTLCAALPLGAEVSGAETAAKARASTHMTLTDAVTLVTTKHSGRVISAHVDPVQGDAHHVHVDLLLPNGRIMQVDVNSATGAMRNRLSPEAGPDSLTLVYSLQQAQSLTPGQVVSVEFDREPKPHYHMNFLRPTGEVERLDFDIATRTLSPHVPRG